MSKNKLWEKCFKIITTIGNDVEVNKFKIVLRNKEKKGKIYLPLYVTLTRLIKKPDLYDSITVGSNKLIIHF